MKTTKLILAVLLVMLISSVNSWCQENEADKDNYGVIIGQIIDEDTKQPVDEPFGVVFVDQTIEAGMGSYPESGHGTRSDKKGYFKVKYPLGTYFIQLIPQNENSKYSRDPNPFNFPNTRLNFKVERGKITKVVKKARRTGAIKVNIVDAAGSKINLFDFYKNTKWYFTPLDKNNLFDSLSNRANLRLDLSSDVFLHNNDTVAFNKNEILNGEMQRNLLPAKYTNVKIFFSGLGYGSQKHEDIIVNKNQTTEINIVMNLADRTGVDGHVANQSGGPLGGVSVSVLKKEKDVSGFQVSAWILTDSNGYYKIIGLTPGYYQIEFEKEDYVECESSILIEKSILKKSDLILKQKN